MLFLMQKNANWEKCLWKEVKKTIKIIAGASCLL